jgi:hypothetical protein
MFIGVAQIVTQLSADFRFLPHFSSCGHLGPDVNTASPKRGDAETRNGCDGGGGADHRKTSGGRQQVAPKLLADRLFCVLAL